MRQELTEEKLETKETHKEEEGLREEVLKALAAIPGGEGLDKYFGVSSGKPEQPEAEARRASRLISELRKEPKSGEATEAVLEEIAEQGREALADPDALRALMRKSSRPKVKVPRNFLSLKLSTVHYQ